jgi:hypothetical protein
MAHRPFRGRPAAYRWSEGGQPNLRNGYSELRAADTRQRLLYVLRRSLRPGIIVLGEGHAFGSRRMRKHPEFDKTIGMRFVQIHFAHHLERVQRDRLGIRDDPVDYLDPIHVRLMLLAPAVGIDQRLRQKAEDCNQKQQSSVLRTWPST